MRLYLSSYGLGNATDKLLQMLGGGKNVAVIGNACDARPIDKRQERIAREFAALESLDLRATEIDLRDYFDGSFSAKELEGYDMVWVRGGNVFDLRRAMFYSGFDRVATELIREDKIVYGGYSAGSCVLAPSLHGIELCDPTDDIPPGYKSEIIWDGLAVLPYAIAPHFESDHPESAMIDDVVAYMIKNNIAYKPLRDGEVIIIHNGHEELVA